MNKEFNEKFDNICALAIKNSFTPIEIAKDVSFVITEYKRIENESETLKKIKEKLNSIIYTYNIFLKSTFELKIKADDEYSKGYYTGAVHEIENVIKSFENLLKELDK